MRALIVVAMLGATAHAETRTESYGMQTAIVDAAAGAVMVGGIAGIATTHGTARGLSIAATAVGAATYLLVPPLIHHAKQDRDDKYYASMLMRFLGPGLVGGLAATAVKGGCEEQDFGCDRIAIAGGIGAGVAMIAVSVIDAELLANREIVVTPTPGGATAGLATRF